MSGTSREVPSTVLEAIQVARQHGVSEIELIRTIRLCCDASLDEAKCLLVTGTFDRDKLSEHQERLLAGLTMVLEEERQVHGGPR